AIVVRHEALRRLTGKPLLGLPLDGFYYDTNRGCKVIHLSGGAFSVPLRGGMARAPRVADLKSSRFARLQGIKCVIAGKNLYLRFTHSTGDAWYQRVSKTFWISFKLISLTWMSLASLLTAAALVMTATSDPNPEVSDEQQKRSEIYTYEAPWYIYAMNWSVRRDKKYRLAIASLLEQYPNRLQIVQLDDSNGEIRSDPSLSFDHPYPATKTIFIPDKDCQKPDLLATSSDFLRIWRISDDGSRVDLKSLLNGNKNSEFCGPLTSFDWNEAEPKRIGTSSIDTTCTIWDIEKETVDTQLIAHDKEVYDIAWGGVGVFASVSADGSVRVFDLRDKEHSTIIYESSEPDAPLVRLGWNKQDPRYMATIIMDSAKVVVLDIRFPTLPVVELRRHQASVNAVAWAPHSSCHICTAGDDSQALIWDLSSMGQPVEGGLDPILAYTAGAEIEQLQWSSSQPDWVAIAFSTKLQILRV
ncbi:hypothetical protein Godav_013669, partial [Gossypium davidsonii]|nr:hypothetical protein [Gossypium davidsonii]